MTGTGQAPAPAPKAPAVAWDWSEALLGAAYAVPAALVIPFDVRLGLALAVGVLPATILGLAPTRAARRRTVVMGAFVGVPMLVGSILAQVPWLAVMGLFGLAVAGGRRTADGPIAVEHVVDVAATFVTGLG